MLTLPRSTCPTTRTLAFLGNLLDLAHRLPLSALVHYHGAGPHGFRRHGCAHDLSLDAAAHADRLLVWQPRRLNPHRIGVLVHEARLYADPDRAIADHDAALETRKVEVRYDRGAPGTGEVFMVLDEADTVAFDHTVSTMAAATGLLGHPGSLDVRRAHAVGLLADPQAALDLLAAADDDQARRRPRPRRPPARRPARPTRADGRSGPVPRPHLRLPALRTSVRGLRPRPRRRLRPAGRRRPAPGRPSPDEPRPAVPAAPPGQDLRRRSPTAAWATGSYEWTLPSLAARVTTDPAHPAGHDADPASSTARPRRRT